MKNIEKLVKLLTMSQPQLLEYLYTELVRHGYTDITKTNYALGAVSTDKKIAPCLVAHLDTRNENIKSYPKSIYNAKTKRFDYHGEATVNHYTPTVNDILVTDNYIILSPEADDNLECLGADDRVGVWTILQLLETGLRPHVLFTTDEEIGCVGTGELISNELQDDWSWLGSTSMFVQVDRGVHEGSWNEMVFYDYDETSIPSIKAELDNYYKLAWGSYTDVAQLGEYFDAPLVNLSASYKNEHTRSEFVHLGWLKKNTESYIKFINWIYDQDGVENWVYSTTKPAYGAYSSYYDTDDTVTEDTYYPWVICYYLEKMYPDTTAVERMSWYNEHVRDKELESYEIETLEFILEQMYYENGYPEEMSELASSIRVPSIGA